MEEGQAQRPMPLSGITVVALEQAVAVPFASRQLADLGARVIKVEQPGVGDFARGYDTRVYGQSTYFFWLNRGKQSVALDLKTAAGSRALDKLLGTADVFLHNLAPGAVDRLGLAADSLAARFPNLITCGLSGYGTGGPYGGRRAYDLIVQGEAAVPSITGTPQEGVRVGMSIVDIAGAMYTLVTVLGALLDRERNHVTPTGLEVTLLESITEWMSPSLYNAMYSGAHPQRFTWAHPTLVPYGRYETADGIQLSIGIQNDREWVRFASDVLGQPSLAQDERFRTNVARTANREAVDLVVGEAIHQLPAQACEERLDAIGIAHGRVNDLYGLASHPQLQARQRWEDALVGDNEAQALRPPADIRGYSAAAKELPELGADTRQVLSEIGCSPEDVEELSATIETPR